MAAVEGAADAERLHASRCGGATAGAAGRPPPGPAPFPTPATAAPAPGARLSPLAIDVLFHVFGAADGSGRVEMLTSAQVGGARMPLRPLFEGGGVVT